MEDILQNLCIIFTVMLKIKMYQYKLKFGRIDTFFLGYSNLKDYFICSSIYFNNSPDTFKFDCILDFNPIERK